MATLTATPTYTLRGVKTFRGMDGQGLNATLCRDEKAICDVIDEGSGGMILFRWFDQKAGESAEATLFEAFIEQERAKIPADKVHMYEPLVMERKMFDGEAWINKTADAMANAKRMKRFFKTYTCYQVGKQIGSEEFYRVKGLGDIVRQRIQAQHPSEQIRFMNDEPQG